MPLVGSLSTMPLPDLLQWLAGALKTGLLRIERKRITKVIALKGGRIVGCSSDDPPHRLGQFLLSREKISAVQLREALAIQGENGQHLGRILVEMGAITPDDLTGHLEKKAEETVYSVFDWDDAVFRFEDGDDAVDDAFPVDLRVEDVLLRGLSRFDEMSRIRQVFHDPGIVLRYTSVPPGPEIFSNKMARAMYSAIDGERSVAEILLLVHGSDYIVYKFLFELHRNGYVEIARVKEATQVAAPVVESSPAVAPAPIAPVQPAVASEVPRHNRPALTARSVPSATAVAEPPPAAQPRALATAGPEAGTGFEERLSAARRFMSESEYDAALDLLDVLYRENPGDDALRRLTAEAEAAFVDRAYRHVVPEHKVPVLTRPAAELATEANLSPQEFFLLSRIDGLWDVRSIIQVAPLREVDALRTLKRMRELGMIDLHDPAD
jgi:hypothetical protein